MVRKGITSSSSSSPRPSATMPSVKPSMRRDTGLADTKRRNSAVGPRARPVMVMISLGRWSRSGTSATTSTSSTPKMRPRGARMRRPGPSKRTSPSMPSMPGQPGA